MARLQLTEKILDPIPFNSPLLTYQVYASARMLYWFQTARMSTSEKAVLTRDQMKQIIRDYANEEFCNSGWKTAMLTFRDDDGLFAVIEVVKVIQETPSLPFEDGPRLNSA